METRIFGARRGAGTQVREVQTAKPIQEGPFGSTVLVGLFRSGPVGLVSHLGADHFRRVRGGLSQDGDAPLAAEHFYQAGVGAGTLHTLRVTDGTEVAAGLVVYNRKVDRSLLERSPASVLPTAIMELNADNGGRWAGRRNVKTGKLGTIATAISGSTVDLDFTTLVDAWKGAVLSFPVDDSGIEYTVTGNDATGVMTVAGSFTATTTAGTNGTYVLELENTHELTGNLEALAVEIADSAEIAGGFSLYVNRDGAQVKAWEDLDLDSSGTRHWSAQVAADARNGDNYEIAGVDNFAGDPADAYERPANYAEIPAPGGVSGNVLELQVVRWARSGTGSPYLDTVNDLAWGSDPAPATILITFTAATTYTVSATFTDGETADDLPGGSTGVAWASPNAKIPGFTITAGAVAADATTRLTIYARPLPANLAAKGAWLYVAAGDTDGDTLARYLVVSNTFNTVTLAPSVDLSTEVQAPEAPTMTGTTAGPFALNAASLTLIYTVGGSGPYTLTESLAGAAETTTALAADLNAQELARAGSAAAKLVAFTVSAADKLVITALQDFGGDATILLGNGTLNAVVGFTNAQTASGVDGQIVRLQFRQELGAGYDGAAGLTADHYADAWAVGSSPLNDLEIVNTGVLRLAMPGITDADAQGAAMTWAYENNAVFWAEIPDTVTTEAAAVAWHKANLAIGVAQDYHATPFPSYVKIRNPYGTGLYTCPASGIILGITARKAVDGNGYHNAPAGVEYLLNPIAKDLPTEDRPLNNETLNGYGLIELRKRGRTIYLWGDRIVGYGGRSWLHKRLTVSHVGRTLLVNTDRLVFRRIDGATFAEVKRLLLGLFTPWHRAGWFDDSDGPAFGDQVEIKVDAANNPIAERNLGNLNAAISFNVVDTAERVIFTIGPRGISVS
jgi:hypothetical protein